MNNVCPMFVAVCAKCVAPEIIFIYLDKIFLVNY